MENKILEIIKKYNNNNIISDIKDRDSIIYDKEFLILRDIRKNYFCIFENNDNEDIDDIIANIERACLGNEILNRIKPQFIHAIVIMKTSCLEEKIYTKAVKIEENEYFCKKYIFYYNDNEVENFEKWSEANNKTTFNELMNIETNNEDINKNNKNSIALKFMLRIIIKFIFIKVKVDRREITSFDKELINQINKIKDSDIKSKIDNIFNEDNFNKLMEIDLDKAVEEYLLQFEEE